MQLQRTLCNCKRAIMAQFTGLYQSLNLFINPRTGKPCQSTATRGTYEAKRLCLHEPPGLGYRGALAAPLAAGAGGAGRLPAGSH